MAAAILILTSLLPAAALRCGALRPDNSTAAKLLGTWLYVAGAAQLPRHLLEMLLIDHGYLHVEPGASEQELPITQSAAIGDQCLTNNSTYMEITAGSTTLVKEAKTQQTVGTVMDLSSEDVLLIQHQLQRERTYLGLYLYARNLSMSRAQREEFETHARCLGLSEEGIVYAPWRRRGVGNGTSSSWASVSMIGAARCFSGPTWTYNQTSFFTLFSPAGALPITYPVIAVLEGAVPNGRS